MSTKTDDLHRLAAIGRRIGATSRGTWRQQDGVAADDPASGRVLADMESYDPATEQIVIRSRVVTECGAYGYRDAEFIANAPGDMTWLINRRIEDSYVIEDLSVALTRLLDDKNAEVAQAARAVIGDMKFTRAELDENAGTPSRPKRKMRYFMDVRAVRDGLTYSRV